MKRITIILAALLLASCGTGTFTTRGAVTLAGDKVILCSQWGALPCVGTELDSRDAWTIIEALRAKAALESLLGLPQPAVEPTNSGKAI